MPITFYSLSSFQSDRVNIDLPDVELAQSRIAFSGGCTLNFVRALSGCVDIKNKNYTNFYLTQKTLLEDVIEDDKLKLTPKSFLTPLAFGVIDDNFLSLSSIQLSSKSPTSYGYYYNAVFVPSTKDNAELYKIEIYDETYCKISYQNNISKNYLVLDQSKKAIFSQSLLYDTSFSTTSDIYFKYILNGDKLILLKDISGTTYQLSLVDNYLSAVGISVNPFSRITGYALTILNNITVKQEVSSNTSYINYEPNTLNMNVGESIFNIQNNYLLYRNLSQDKYNNFKVVVLKNQMSDNGSLYKSNNLAISGGNILDNREYTSIAQDIDALEDQNLSLNYTFYNKSINIVPGKNYFKTEKSLFPFSQININDTTFINSGSFSSLAPAYADKVTLIETAPSLNRYEYLCTWLSGAPLSNQKIWVDRYYYPDIASKEAALIGNSIYNETYDMFIEELVSSNAQVKSSTEDTLFFDKVSDMVFRANQEYSYDRIDLNNLDFVASKSSPTVTENFYQIINDNNGFCFACNILSYSDQTVKKIYSKVNRKNAGLTISYNSSYIDVKYTTFNIATQKVDTIAQVNIPALPVTSNNIVFSANHKTGSVVCYINGVVVLGVLVCPLFYNPLFGDIVVEGQNVYASQDFITDLTLTTQPLNDEELELLVARYNDSNAGFSISLPCGQRNKSDVITHINSLQTNLKSKSNDINIYINNLNIDSATLQETIKLNVATAVQDVLPVNVRVKKLEILS